MPGHSQTNQTAWGWLLGHCHEPHPDRFNWKLSLAQETVNYIVSLKSMLQLKKLN